MPGVLNKKSLCNFQRPFCLVSTHLARAHNQPFCIAVNPPVKKQINYAKYHDDLSDIAHQRAHQSRIEALNKGLQHELLTYRSTNESNERYRSFTLQPFSESHQQHADQTDYGERDDRRQQEYQERIGNIGQAGRTLHPIGDKERKMDGYYYNVKMGSCANSSLG